VQKLRERLRQMSDEELIKFGKQVRALSAPRIGVVNDPWPAQLRMAREEWSRRHPKHSGLKNALSTVRYRALLLTPSPLVSVNDTPADKENMAAVGIECQAVLPPTNQSLRLAGHIVNADRIDLRKERQVEAGDRQRRA